MLNEGVEDAQADSEREIGSRKGMRRFGLGKGILSFDILSNGCVGPVVLEYVDELREVGSCVRQRGCINISYQR